HILDSLPTRLPVMEFQFVFAGSVIESLEIAFHQLMVKYFQAVAGHFMISQLICEQIYDASSILLMPSNYEPCGLVQLIAMRYGSIPVVRNTGGLADTVTPYDPINNEGTGFMFDEFSSTALTIQTVRALEVYRHKTAWKGLMKRAMSQDFSWNNSAKEYERFR